MSGVYWVNFLQKETVIFNLKVALVFILLWFLVSIVLFFWTKSRILKSQSVNIRLLSSLLGIVLIFNISMYFFYNIHDVKRDSPNIIVILVDCLRADHLSSYGYSRNTTPNIDEFSKDAVIFTQAISQATFTKMSIASLFTSLYPYQHGIYRGAGERLDIKGNVVTDVLGEDNPTLAKVLSQNGFLTTAWINAGQLTSYFGFDQGFVEYNERLGDAGSTNKKFLEWAGRTGKKHKFFAYIHYLDLHGPYRPKPPYDTLYLSETGGYNDKLTRKQRYADQQKALYDGALTYIDSEVGILLDKLKKEGLYDNSLIILTADHGDAFGEHGFFTHSFAPYEELIRVPLIIRFPKSFSAGKMVKRQVRLIDVMPTILDFLKIKTDSKLSGFSLLNYLDNKQERGHEIDYPKYAISEIYNRKDGLDALSIRTEQFKYIHYEDRNDELYDLKLDPKEKKNIIKLKPEVADEFRQMLLPMLAEKNKNRVLNTTKIDKKTVEELKALGYIQ